MSFVFRGLVQVGVLALLAGCAHTAPEVVWTSFGRADPAGDSEQVAEWRKTRELLVKHAKNPDAVVTFKGKKGTASEFARGPIERLRNIEVLVDTVPPGLVIEKDSARVTSDGNWTVVGKFTLHYRGATRSLKEALDDVRVLTDTVEGDVAVITWARESQTQTRGAAGFILSARKARPERVREL